MADHLKCGVCFEPYSVGLRLPKFLQCGGGIQHTYCLQCLRRMTAAGLIQCPSCGDLTSVSGRSADDLKNNIYLLPQIEQAAAAKAENGAMFCRSCEQVATAACVQHQLWELSELRDLLRQMTEEVVHTTETIKQKRSVPLELLKDSHSVLLAVAESVRRTVEDYDMDIQLDENIVGELERKREAVEFLRDDQLADEYKIISRHLADATATLLDSAVVADHCSALADSSVGFSLASDGTQVAVPVGAWLRSGALMRALLAASVVIYSIDHVSSAPDDPVNSDHAEHCETASETAELISVGTKTSKLHKVDTAVKPSPNSICEAQRTSNDNGVTKRLNSVVPKDLIKSVIRTDKSSASSVAKNAKAANGYSQALKTADGEMSSAAGVAPVVPSNGASSAKAEKETNSTPTSAASCPDTTAKSTVSFSAMLKCRQRRSRETVPPSPRSVHPRYCLLVTNGSSTVDVVVELRSDMAPIMCNNFVKLCEGGFYDNTRFHYISAGEYLLGGVVDNGDGFSPLAHPPEKFVQADLCPLLDECGAIRMKGMGTTIGPGGERRGLIGSQFMVWVSEQRKYRSYQNTLVFGFVRQGLQFIRNITHLDRPTVWRNVRLLSTQPYRL